MYSKENPKSFNYTQNLFEESVNVYKSRKYHYF